MTFNDTKDLPLFSSAISSWSKDSGMSRAANAKRELLEIAKRLAREIARQAGTCNMDQVNQRLLSEGHDCNDLGNAAGSVFKGSEWVFTGQRIKSSKVAAHAREIKVWRLVK